MRKAFSLVEVLVATALTLVLMGMVVTLFANIGGSISSQRALIETTERHRHAQKMLQRDLECATALPIPPLNPADGQGYLEIIEGPNGPILSEANYFVRDEDGDGTFSPDTSIGDMDDVLMLTIRSPQEPLVGRYSYKREPIEDDPMTTTIDEEETPDGNDGYGDFKWEATAPDTIIVSTVAEVCWFMRGTTLHRRVMLVHDGQLPDADRRNDSPDFTYDPLPTTAGFYWLYDLSVHQVGGALDRSPTALSARLFQNTLGDLTERENRFAHQPCVYPYHARFWGRLGLPTMRETDVGSWPFPYLDAGLGTQVQSANYPDAYSQVIVPDGVAGTPLTLNAAEVVTLAPIDASTQPPDAWANRPYPFNELSQTNGFLLAYPGGRTDDVILTNCLGFDVEVFDPGAPLLRHNTTGVLVEPSDLGYINAISNIGTSGDEYTVSGQGAYVDLNYLGRLADGDSDGRPDAPVGTAPEFHHAGDNAMMAGSAPASGNDLAATYDTWSTSYETDGLDNDGDGLIDEGANGADEDGLNGVDDISEKEAPPPYSVPLRSLRVTIRVREAESRQVREVTVYQDFLPR